MCKKLLVISPFTAYKNIKHAGGKIHFYYLSKLLDKYDITIISSAYEKERKDISDSIINVNTKYIYFIPQIQSIWRKIKIFYWTRNPFDKYAGFQNYDLQHFLYKTAKKLQRQLYTPDVVILDWTQSIFLSKKIKKLFPYSTIIGIEQDVTYLKYRRFIDNSTNFIKKQINKLKYINIKHSELESLKNTNQIITLNNKDTDLLKSDLHNNIQIKTIVPYFDNYFHVVRKNINMNIIYYGAMSRPENYESAIWFINNVLPKLPNNFKFIIIGNSPAKELIKYANNRVEITGFVQDISLYFESSLCFAAPIVMGAGIKIKILEAMSAGITVITNDIGIEGIPAVNNKDYIHCTSADEFAREILKLSNDKEKNITIGNNAKLFIQNNFNYMNCSYI